MSATNAATNGYQIFLVLYCKFPELLYCNYVENAQLLAEWLCVSQGRRDFQDLYALQELEQCTQIPRGQLAYDLQDTAAVIELRQRIIAATNNDTSKS